MRKPLIGILRMLMIALPATASDPAASSASQGTAADTLAQFRDDLQAAETEIVSKAVALTTDEATKFWPVFKRFQAEQKLIIDGQIAALGDYFVDYASLSDEQATKYVGALLERDQRIHDLRVKCLAEYSKALPAGKAARVIHISRRLGLASQNKLGEAGPLVR